jgi:hypothetical protein
MSTKKRTQRRAEERKVSRERDKLVRDAERLFELEPGGTLERPLEVESPAQIDVVVRGLRCPLHALWLGVGEHLAVTTSSGERVRVVLAVCPRCERPRRRFFRVGRTLS